MADETAPVLGLALGDAALTRLLADRDQEAFTALSRALEGTAGVLYLGGDRFRRTETPYLDPLFAAQALLTRLPHAAALVSVSPDLEHPFNYARRTLTVDHYSQGRLGVVVGTRDRRAPRRAAEVPWTGTPVSSALTAEFLTVLRELWNSWPRESIIADGGRGVFADSSQIVSIDHESSYSVAGPLNAPSSIQGEPPLGWHLAEKGEPAAEREAAAEAELLIAEAQDGCRVTLRGGSSGDDDAGRALLISVPTVEHLQETAGRLPDQQSSASPARGTLRERLGLRPRRLDLAAFTPTFGGTP